MTCTYCDAAHVGVCPKVSAIEYFENGVPRMVHFFPPAAAAIVVEPEDDEAYRRRLLIVITPSSVNYEKALVLSGAALDNLGRLYDTSRAGNKP